MKYKFNPLTGEFNLVPDSGTLKQKLNWLTGNFNLTKDAGKYKQIYNVIEGEFNLYPATTQVVIHGTGSIQLTNAVENGLLSLKAFGGTEQRNLLPSGYTEVEYVNKLSTAASGRFSTGITPTVDDIEFEIDVVASTGSWYLFQAQRNTGQPIYGISGAQSGAKISFNRGDGSATSSITRTTGNRYYIKATAKNGEGTLYVKNVTTDVEDTQTFTYTFTAIDTWIGVFGTQRGTCVQADNSVYYAKLKVNGTLVVNFVPAKTDTEVGFYDTVSGNFVLPINGIFEAGPNVVPTPTAPMDIVCNNGVLKFSKNMANVNSQTALVGYYISSQGVVTADVYNRIYQDFIPCKPNTTYTLSMSQSVYYVSISEYSTAEDSGFVIRKAGSTGSNTRLTITTGANTNYLRFGTNLDRTSVTLEEVLAINWQLEQGDTPTPYHEYVEGGVYTDGDIETIEDELGNTATAEMLLKVGDYVDEQEILSGDITRKIGVKVLDGTEDWKNLSGYFNISKTDIGSNSTVMPSNSHNIICSHFETKDGTFSNGVGIGGNYVNFKYDSIATTLVNWKQRLSDQYNAGTPVIVVYPLATSTTETVEGQPLNIPAGDSTIEIVQASIDNLELEVIYEQGA